MNTLWLGNLKGKEKFVNYESKDNIKMYFTEIILQLGFCGQCQIQAWAT
jgi:hypothetical protein